MVLHLKDNKYNFDVELLYCIVWNHDKKAHSMLQGHDPAELCDSSGSTLLHYSAKHGNAVMTEYFIDRGCAIDAKDNDDSTPLMLAVKSNCKTTVKILLEAGANIYASSETPKGSAGSLLNEVIIKSCMGLIFEEVDEILILIRQEVFEQIFQKVKEDFVSDRQGMAKMLHKSDCPLHYVIWFFKNTDITQHYLANGYPVDAREPERGCTPLHVAVSRDDLANVKALLEHGADANSKDNSGKNALFYYNGLWVLNEDKLDILRILIQCGASLFLQDEDGNTPVEKLLCEGQKEVVSIILQHVDPLAKYGYRERTVLHLLTLNYEMYDITVFESLWERYLDVNATDIEGKTALSLAIVHGRQAEKIDFMLRKGADSSAFYTTGTMLKDVIFESWISSDVNDESVKIVELFLLYGVDLRSEIPTFKSIFNKSYFDDSSLAKLLVAHLVLLEEGGYNFREYFVPNVKKRPVLAKLFKEYKLHLEELKLSSVYESITMFDLLVASDKKLIRYAANEELISNFELIADTSHSKWYYYTYVQKRMAIAVDTLKYQRKASLIISRMTGIQQQLILDKIIDYLRIWHFQSLIEINRKNFYLKH